MIGRERCIVIIRKENIVGNADIGRMRKNFGNGWLRVLRRLFA
jgi:hypothetical protein